MCGQAFPACSSSPTPAQPTLLLPVVWLVHSTALLVSEEGGAPGSPSDVTFCLLPPVAQLPNMPRVSDSGSLALSQEKWTHWSCSGCGSWESSEPTTALLVTVGLRVESRPACVSCQAQPVDRVRPGAVSLELGVTTEG